MDWGSVFVDHHVNNLFDLLGARSESNNLLSIMVKAAGLSVSESDSASDCGSDVLSEPGTQVCAPCK